MGKLTGRFVGKQVGIGNHTNTQSISFTIIIKVLYCTYIHTLVCVCACMKPAHSYIHTRILTHIHTRNKVPPLAKSHLLRLSLQKCSCTTTFFSHKCHLGVEFQGGGDHHCYSWEERATHPTSTMATDVLRVRRSALLPANSYPKNSPKYSPKVVILLNTCNKSNRQPLCSK